MIEIKVDTTDLESKLARLDIAGMRTAVGVAVAEEARAELARYPSPARKRQAFVSANQRRAFFAKLRSGQISVPYRRTGQLGNRWLTQPNGDGATLTNTAPYSDLVQSAKGQAGYHKGVWVTDEETARKVESSGAAERVAGQVVEDALRKAGLS